MLSPSLWRVFVRNWRTFFLTYILPTIPSDMNDTRTVQQSDPFSPPESSTAPSLPDDTDRLDMIEIARGAQDLHEQEWQDRQPQIDRDPVSAQQTEADTDNELPLTDSQQDQLPVQDIQTEPTGQIGLNTTPETVSCGDLLVLLGETWQPLGALIESLLFVADKPVEVSQIARTLSLNVETVEASLRRLADA